MNIIDDNKLDTIKGGAVSPVLVVAIVSAVVIFIAGVIEGFTNPEKCN